MDWWLHETGGVIIVMRGKGGVLTFTRLVCRASIGDINPKVRDLGRSDAGGIVRVGIHQKMGEESPERKF